MTPPPPTLPTASLSSSTSLPHASHAAAGSSNSVPVPADERKIHSLVLELINSKDREHALLELSKIRETYDSLAVLLWHSFGMASRDILFFFSLSFHLFIFISLFLSVHVILSLWCLGVMSALLQEVVSLYPLLNHPTLTANASTRVCNALALMQCIASHPETRPLFIKAQFPLYLYPILNTSTKSRPFEYLRLTSLGIVGALVKNDNSDVIAFLLTTEIIPLCLRIMESGNELCKTVAIFIVQKTLLDDLGLNYICQTYERFYTVVTVLNNMTASLVESPSIRLLKHVVRCYLRLSDNKK